MRRLGDVRHFWWLVRRHLGPYWWALGVFLLASALATALAATVRNAVRGVVMNRGGIEAVGSHRDLMAANETYRQLLGGQLGHASVDARPASRLRTRVADEIRPRTSETASEGDAKARRLQTWLTRPLAQWPPDVFDELGIKNPNGPSNLSIVLDAITATRGVPGDVVECGVVVGHDTVHQRT